MDGDRPNAILCMTDDQGWGDTSYNGHAILRTPSLDRMAADSLRFNRFYAAAALLLSVAVGAQAGDFFAYYTRLHYDPPQDLSTLVKIPVSAAEVFAGRPEQAPSGAPRPGPVRWGRYADLLVNLAEGQQLVFSRATGYLPYLQTANGRFPFKQLAECRDDPLCLCSYVRLVEDGPGRIVVHWRHVPDPARVVMTEVIHEVFIITPDGKVRREVRVGTPRLDDYNDPANVTIQELSISVDGISERSLTRAATSGAPAAAVAGSPVKDPIDGSPAVWLKFDDGLKPSRDQTIEAVHGTACPIAGNKALWKKGVSGTALAFDGYFSKVTLPKAKAPVLKDELTLEAWVLLGAYPWNDAGIVHQSAGEPIRPEEYKHGYRDPYTYRPWTLTGYMLGIDPYGRPIFKVNGEQVGGGVVEDKETPAGQERLPTYRWTHLAATYGKGTMSLYLNGQLTASKAASGPVLTADRDVLIGLNGDPQRISDPVSHSTFAAKNNLPLQYGIEGLIDEVRIYDRVLSAEEVRQSFQAQRPAPADAAQPDLDRRILPGEVTGAPAAKFGATCRTLTYHELWDNLWRPSAHRDIVVRFDSNPGSVVFWAGTNFGSGWVTENNKWMSDQSWEISGPHGCAEHMADKRGRFDHVRLIENTEARVVVHWRYASIDVGYVFPGANVWADEYYTIYPDGVGVRCLDGITGGWQDTQFLSQPGTTCLDNMDLTALTVANMTGESRDLTWQTPNRAPANPLKDACIKRINFKSTWKVFAIYKQGAVISQWGDGEQSKHTADPFAGPWNHWPVGLNPSDGRYAVSDDRVTHAALGGADHTGNLIIYGFTDQPAASLATLAKSWNHPPTLERPQGCASKGYDQAQRAYLLSATAKPLSFTLNGSKDSPVCNPCFVISDWDRNAVAAVTVNGAQVEAGRAVRQGIVRDTAGQRQLVLWLKMESVLPIDVNISESPDEVGAK